MVIRQLASPLIFSTAILDHHNLLNLCLTLNSTAPLTLKLPSLSLPIMKPLFEQVHSYLIHCMNWIDFFLGRLKFQIELNKSFNLLFKYHEGFILLKEPIYVYISAF